MVKMRGAASGWSIQNEGRFSNNGTWFAEPSGTHKIAIRGTITGIAISNDATLSALTLKDGNDNLVPLSPAFSATTDAYTAEVARNVNSVTLTATKNDAGASVAIGTLAQDEGTFPLRWAPTRSR